MTLYERASRYVAMMEPAIEGQHGSRQLLHVACVLVQGFDLPRDQARQVLDEYNPRCVPPWSERELEHVLTNAEKKNGLETKEGLQPRGCMVGEHGDRDDSPREPRAPSQAPSVPLPSERPAGTPGFNPVALKTFAARWRQYVDTAWLSDRSPVTPYRLTGRLTASEFLGNVFREGEKVLVFTNQQSQGQAVWPLQNPPQAGDEGVWFLAQPVDGCEHPNPRTGTTSRRSEESVTDWRHMVLESDEADPRDWLGALVQLKLRIVAIYTSGGRSIHALVRVDAPSKHEWDNVKKQLRAPLVILGADPGAMSAVRLTRLPGCHRGDKLQKLLFLNPEPSPKPISTLPRLRDTLAPWLAGARNLLTVTAAEALADEPTWQTYQSVRTALLWFANAAPAREMLAQFDTWEKA